MVDRSDARAGDPREPVLRDAEAELERRLTEACAAEPAGIANETTAAIRRLEDSRLSAAATGRLLRRTESGATNLQVRNKQRSSEQRNPSSPSSSQTFNQSLDRPNDVAGSLEPAPPFSHAALLAEAG